MVDNVCVPCPPGQISADIHALQCTSCPAGTKADVSQCVQCPINSYSEQPDSTECISCSAGRTTPSAGSTTVTACFSPLPNFSFATIALAVNIMLVFVYMVNGRFFRIGFLRKERIVLKLVSVLKDISSVFDAVSILYTTRKGCRRG